MKRGFSREHTPLFPRILAIHAEEGKGSGHPSKPQPPPSTAQPTNEEPILNVATSSHQKTQTPTRKKKARTPQPLKKRLFKVRVGSSVDENLNEEDPSKHGRSMIEEIDQDAGVTLVQINAEDQGKVTPT
uniref:Uncharacterized protein n=1 Tax=Tanacetum cinerariifolium TaxID=118510 RepID=A0A6L2J892_TANCI|nr:hypothetical protein [Tanacetum cinerariifolium]